MDDFLFFGGYPGAASLIKDEERWARNIGSSIVDSTISQDILMMEEVRKPALLRSLFLLGSSYSGMEVSYTKLLGRLQDAGNTVTLAHYLELLNRAQILSGLQKLAGNKISVRKSSPRLMAYNTAFMTYSDGATRRRFLDNPTDRGHLIESAVGAYLLSRSQEDGFDVYWWRDRDKEVDFVLQKGGSVTAIEVKSGRIKNVGGSLPFVFLKSTSPYGNFSASVGSFGRILARRTQAVGVVLSKGMPQGSHALRHTLASAMLSKGATLQTIASTLGHATSKSTAIYLHSDISRLSDCILDPEEFYYENI